MIAFVESLAASWFSGMLGLCLYWLPLAVNAVAYTGRTWAQYRSDVERRERAESGTTQLERVYCPTLTLGTIVGCLIATVVPVMNLLALVFDAGWYSLTRLWAWCERALNVPVVRRRS